MPMLKNCFQAWHIKCLFAFFAASLSISCATRITGPLRADGSAELNITASLEPRTANLIRSLASVSGTVSQGSLVVNGPAIAQSMSAAPGVASVTLRNTAPAAVEGLVRVSKINDFLASGSRGFINFEQNSGGGRMLINVNRQTSPQILSLFSSEISDYLSALMAPIATGEVLTRAEYLDLVTSVYNRGVSDEISASRVYIEVSLPSAVRSVRGGTFSGRQAIFDVRLLDLLVLETPLSYEVVWN
jgi:hypothetical protein